MTSSICWRDNMMPGIGGCGFISHPRIHAGFALLSRAIKDSGGTPSVATVLASVAWQDEQEFITRLRPASASPRGVAATAGPAEATAKASVTFLYLPNVMAALRIS